LIKVSEKTRSAPNGEPKRMPRVAESDASFPRRVAPKNRYGVWHGGRVGVFDRSGKHQPTRAGAGPRSDSRAHAASQHWLSYKDFGILAAVSDVLAIVVASIITGIAYHWLAFGYVGSIAERLGVGVLLAAIVGPQMKLRGLYTPDNLLSVRPQVSPVTCIWSTAVLLLIGVSFALKVSEEISRASILLVAIVAPLLILGQRVMLRSAMLASIKKGRLKRSRIIVITRRVDAAPASHTASLVHDIAKTYELPHDGEDIRLAVADIVRAARGLNIGEIHLAMDWDRWSDTKQILTELRVLPIPVRLIADGRVREILQYPRQQLRGVVSFELQRAPLTACERVAKRAFDLAAATVGLLAIAPVLLVISLAVRIESPGPILFRQIRGGFNGRTFEIFKFRTMFVVENGPTIIQATSNDRRVTRLGRLLRRYSIDELPQLFNVLRGDMSLVGPRPHALAHDRQYGSLISTYPCRHHVKPGITGWAQVNGFRGETPMLQLMKQRVELDLWYVTNWSFLLDLRILCRTVLEICRSRNAF
jgi:Undecaprenyl-phosphate glucose phosphotransferase